MGSFSEASVLGSLVALISIALGLTFMLGYPGFPRTFALAIPALSLTLMAAGRWAFRVFFRSENRRNSSDQALAALVYGAGDAGHQVARLVDKAEQSPYRIVGFVDDDPGRRFLRVRGYRVMGQGHDVIDLARAGDAEIVILAISAPDPGLIKGLVRPVHESRLEAGDRTSDTRDDRRPGQPWASCASSRSKTFWGGVPLGQTCGRLPVT